MKLNNKFTLISVALMTGAACLTACSSDEVAENPGLSADGESVKTEFAINIPRAKSARMTAGNTQNGENPTFRGMQNIRLIPFNTESTNLAKTSVFNTVIGLGNIADNNGLNKGVKKYSNVNIPIGTKSFVFYGHAPQGTENGTPAIGEEDSRFALGLMNENVTDKSVNTLEALEFSMVSTIPNNLNIADNDQAKKLVTQLNELAKLDIWLQAPQDSPAKELYNNFIKLKAGSANSVLLVMQDLYNAVEKFKTDDPSNIASAIQTAIIGDKGLFNKAGKPDDVTGDVQLTWKNDPLTFPKNLNLPEGVARVTYDNGFKYVTNRTQGTGTVMGDMTIDENKITYPASLYYTTISRVAASHTADIPTSITEWKFDSWDQVVKTNSKSVALADKVNYGVANFAVTVKCDGIKLPTNGTQEATQSAVEVNMNGDDYVTVPDEGFTLTGVLVGGQYQKVDYKFDPKENEIMPLQNTGGSYTIYDRDIQNVRAKTNFAEGTNYTLVLPTNEKDDNIQFALEFKNDAVGFYGKDGFIPHGATFYVVGKLVKQNANSQGNQDNATRIFQQDYKTTANVTLKTLKNAYYTLPDLRATNLSFGLAVDLTWQKGYVFDVTIE